MTIKILQVIKITVCNSLTHVRYVEVNIIHMIIVGASVKPKLAGFMQPRALTPRGMHAFGIIIEYRLINFWRKTSIQCNYKPTNQRVVF